MKRILSAFVIIMCIVLATLYKNPDNLSTENKTSVPDSHTASTRVVSKVFLDANGNEYFVEATGIIPSGEITFSEGTIFASTEGEYRFVTNQFIKIVSPAIGKENDLKITIALKSDETNRILKVNRSEKQIEEYPVDTEENIVTIEETAKTIEFALVKEFEEGDTKDKATEECLSATPFTILERTGNRLHVRLSECLATDTKVSYKWLKTYTIEDEEIWEDERQYESEFTGDNENEFILDNLKSGRYRITVNKILEDDNDDKLVMAEFWKQDVYIPYPIPENHRELAERFLPIGVYHQDEVYFPVSVDSLFINQSNDNFFFRFKTLRGQKRIPVNDVIDWMATNGHVDYRMNFKMCETYGNIPCEEDSTNFCLCNPSRLRYILGDRSAPVLYYDLVKINDRIFISYYTFYAFDMKQGDFKDPGLGAHTLDRESYTVELDASENPISITMGNHIGNTTDFLGRPPDNTEENLPMRFGRLKLSWKHALKIGNSPAIFYALGSHAVYPIYGTFKTYIVEEVAGSVKVTDKVILPSQWVIKQLDYNDPKLRFLNYSGFIPDVLGSTNSKYPPSVRRHHVESWVDDADTPFHQEYPDTLKAEYIHLFRPAYEGDTSYLHGADVGSLFK